MKWFNSDNRRGATLIELVVSIGIFAVAGSSIAFLVLSAYRSSDVGGERSQAAAVGREGWEAVKSIGTGAYNKLKIGTYGLSDGGGNWVFSGASDTDGKYTRTVQIEAVDRDGSGNIASGTNDIHTRKATTTVSWLFGAEARTLSFADYFTNWDSRRFLEDVSADFSDGTFTNTAVNTMVDLDGSIGLVSAAALFACGVVEGIYDKVGSSDANDVFVSGTYAYLVTDSNVAGGEFFVVDITDTENPTLTGSLELGTDVRSVWVIGNYAYIATTANNSEFQVINVTIPAVPSVVGTLNLTGNEDANDLVASGTQAYLVRDNLAGGAEFYVIGIGTPSSPSLSGSVDLGGASRGVQLSGNYAYAVTDGNAAELRIVDVSVPATPTVVATVDLPSGADGMEVDVSGTYAYVVTGNNPGGSEFYVINITTPTLPTVSGSVDLGNGANVVEMDGTLAMIGTSSGARPLQIVDAIAPSLPVLSVSLDLSNGDYSGLFWNGTRLFAATTDSDAELHVIKLPTVTSWACIERRDEIDTPGSANGNGVYVVGTTVYGVTMISNGGRFYIMDASDPSNIVLVGSLDLGANANDVVVSGSYAYIASASNTQELQVVDISTPSVPTLVGTYNAAGNADANGINIRGTKILLMQGSMFYHIDVTTPSAPALLGSLDLGSIGRRIEVLNATHAFVATEANAAEVQVINISANTPTLAGSFNAPGNSDGMSLWIKGSQLFLTTMNNGAGAEFYVLDISTPTAPTQTGSLNLDANSRAVAADNDETFAFAASDRNSQSMRVIDVIIPTVPNQVATVSNLLGNVNDLFFANDLVYLASQVNTAEFSIYGKLTGGGGGGGFPLSGTYVSSVLDASASANWNTIEWSEYVTGCGAGNIQLQVRTATTSGGLSGELWQGPDGEDADETDFFTDLAGELIDTTHNGDQFAQYRATLTGDGTCTQYLTDITLTYTPI